MKTRTFLQLVAVLFAALTLPTEVSAQSTNVRPRNTNQSAKFKSGIFKGSGNLIGSNSIASFIGGGQSNTIFAGFTNGVIDGGFGNVISNHFTTVGGGLLNTASGYSATVSGGAGNTASGDGAKVGGGAANTASGYSATVGGGGRNEARGASATIGGGYWNTASATNTTVGGGLLNTASGYSATVGGGVGNTASGDYSFVAGRRAKTTGAGQFVWADSQDEDYEPSWLSPNDTFNVRARGGVRFTTGSAGLNQTVYWVAGGASWSFTSDAATKEGVRGVDAREVLRRVASLPVTEWNYIGYLQRHIGPMAQDWHSAFPLNKDDKAIDTADMHGVSIAAIKGLVEELKDRDAQHAKDLSARDAEIDALKAKMEVMEERLNALPPAH